MALQNRMRRQHTGDARSRTPSPMFLDHQGQFSTKDAKRLKDAGFGEVAYEQATGYRTPREFWSTTEGLHTWPRNARGVPSMAHGEFQNRQMLGNRQSAPGAQQEAVWSTIPGGALAAASSAGHGRNFRTPEVVAPYPMQENVSSTFSASLGQSLAREAGNTSYAGYPNLEAEVHQIMQQHFQQQQHLSDPKSSLGAEITRILRDSQDGLFNPGQSMPLPPAPLCAPCAPQGSYADGMPSIGSIGHPHSCKKGCKYVWKKRGCRDGRDCPQCHFCTPNSKQQSLKAPQPNQQEQAQVDSSKLPSVGSLGHPHSCAAACKYNGKKAGCKDGRLCNRCHLCRWTRCMDRTAKEASIAAEAKAAEKTREISTQTSVDQSTQCDLSQGDSDDVIDKEPLTFGEGGITRFSC